MQSDQSIHVVYNGINLSSHMQCFWKVMVWDKDGIASQWSEMAQWSMGLLHADDWQAKWIGAGDPQTSPFYRQSFEVDDIPERATIYVAGLGYFQLYINGQMIGNHVLVPAVSNFSKRSYYLTYDVKDYLKKGKNSIGIWMGTGWYSPGLPGVQHHSPVVRAQLELYGKSQKVGILTDGSWQVKPSERQLLGKWRWGNFGGEHVDARAVDNHWWNMEKSTKGWKPVVEVETADVPCSSQPCPGNHQLDPITPRVVEKLDDETVLVDFGTNLTGLMRMTFRNLKPAQKITLYYADLDGRHEDDEWRLKQARKGFAVYGQYDEFVSAGAAEETFNNIFNYHAFRYVLDSHKFSPPNSALRAGVFF